MMHSSTMDGSTPARRTASLTTSAPSSVAVNPFSAPRNFPVGVRTAETITDSRTADLDGLHRIRAEKLLQPPDNHARRPHHLPRPLRAPCLDAEHPAYDFHHGCRY